MTKLTQNLLKELFDYRDGELYWKVAKARRVKIGDLAGSIGRDGYRAVGIDNKLYKAHRLIFLYYHGHLPEFLDHIDGNPLNNNIENLREATLQENQMNGKKRSSHNSKPTSSKFKGVYRDKRDKKWMAYIRIDGKLKHLGYFTSEIEAAKTYNGAATAAFGEFAKINEV